MPRFGQQSLISCLQGDLFSEAPQLPVSEDKKLNESLKSTAHGAGNADIYRQDTNS